MADYVDYGMGFTYLYIGMTGQRFTDKMNQNLNMIDQEFLSQSNAISIRVTSNDIKEIKIDNGVVYYTISTSEPKTWVALQSSWGKIVGTLSEQTDLQAALDLKASQTQLDSLNEDIEAHDESIVQLTGSLAELSEDLTALDSIINSSTGVLVRLGALESSIIDKISSSSVVSIRQKPGDTSLEYTTDGINWVSVSTAGVVEWGDINGDILNQTDLYNFISGFTESIASINESLSGHISDYDNPHQVDKIQIGLGNVENLTPAGMPLSDSQKTYIDNAISALPFKSMTQAQYEAMQVSSITATPHVDNTGITAVSITKSTFETQYTATGTYIFTRINSEWNITGSGTESNVSLATYGIVATTGTATDGDIITVVYTAAVTPGSTTLYFINNIDN